MPEFIELENWPPNSPDLSPLYYYVGGRRCNRWYATDQLKPVLINCWAQLPKEMVIKAKGAHVEFHLS